MKNTIPAVKSDPASAKLLWIVSGSLAFIIGLYQAINLKWVSDDAFITFRYVKNVIGGHGFVYNPGEHIEGYTHFLWLILLSAANIVGIDPVTASMWLGIFSYAGILTILILITKKEYALENSVKYYLPLAAMLLALNYDMAVWASGGLETAFYTLLILLAFFTWFYSPYSENRRLLLTGFILTLCTLTRPDGAVFIFCATVLLIGWGLKEKQTAASIIKKITLLILPSLTIGIPYLLWKYFYYGNVLPNTFYTKSASENYFAQGFFYIWLFFRVYFSSLIAIILFASLSLVRKGRIGEISKPQHTGSPVIAAASVILLYLFLYVAQVGGDFMFARFIIPVLPLIYFLVERLWEKLSPVFKKYQWAVALLLLTSVIFENNFREKVLFHTDENGSRAGNWTGEGGGDSKGIADERDFYYYKGFNIAGTTRGFLDVYSEAGKFYEPFFRGIPATIVVSAAQNMVGYYGNFATCIDEFGLTDSAIAHSPITKRGRIGHEKQGTMEYFRMRKAQFILRGIIPNIPEPMLIGTALFEIPKLGMYQFAEEVVYDSVVTHELLRRFDSAGVKVILTKYEEVIPMYISRDMERFTAEQIERDYEKFKKLYFTKYPNPDWQHTIEDAIARKRSL